MGSNPVWKKRERQIAACHGCHRTPLSGGNGRITRGDMIHPKIFLDNKNAKSHAAMTTLEEIRKRAKAEEKVGVLTLTQSRKHGYAYVVHSDDVVAFLRALAEDLDFIQQAVCDESILSADTLYIGPSLQSRNGVSTVKTIGDAVAASKKRVRVVVRCQKKKEQRRKAKIVRRKKRSTSEGNDSKEEASSSGQLVTAY